MGFISALIDAALISGITIPAMMFGFYLSKKRFTKCIIPIIILAIIDHFLVQALYIIKNINGNILLNTLASGILPNIIAFIIIALAFFFLSKIGRNP